MQQQKTENNGQSSRIKTQQLCVSNTALIFPQIRMWSKETAPEYLPTRDDERRYSGQGKKC